MILLFSIFSSIGNMFSSLVTITEVIIWAVTSIDDVISLLTTALNSVISMLGIFPETVANALMGVCGGLFILRILGRS